MLRAVIYKRVSTRMQVDKFSLPAQEKILKECIEKENRKLVEVYCDAGISGERIVDRPDFLRLLNDAEQKKFDSVWVIDQNRLSRGGLADLDCIKSVFKENNIQICTPYQKFTLTDVDDDFLSDFFGILGKRERLKIKQAADRGRKEKAEKGEWGGRTPPFGYTYDKQTKHLVENSEESIVYRQIVSLFLDKGCGIKRIANELNKLGLRTRLGGEWIQQSIHNILRNATYTGALVHQKYQKYLTKVNKYCWRPGIGKYVQDAHKSLISKETFNAIQLRLLQNRNRRKTFYSLQLLTDILECSLCHNRFKVGTTSHGKYRRWIYRCKTRYAHWFDKDKPNCSMRTFDVATYNTKIWNRIQEVARRPDLIKIGLEQSKTLYFKSIHSKQEEIDKISHKLDKFETYKDNAITMRIENSITKTEFDRQMQSLESKYQGFVFRKKELTVKMNYLKRMASEGIDKETILRYTKLIRQSDKKLDIPQKRRILESFLKKIPIYSNGEFELVFKFQISEKLQPEQFQLTTSVQTDGSVTG